MFDKKEKNHYTNLTPEEEKKDENQKRIRAYVEEIVGSILYSFCVVWLLQLGGFFSGGATGLSQLIVSLIEKFTTSEAVKNFANNNLGTVILLVNVPLLFIGWRGVSKRFTILTIMSILIQTIVMNILSTYTVSPFVFILGGNGSSVGDGLIDMLRNGSFTILKNPTTIAAQEAFKANMAPGTKLLLAIFAGLTTGLSAAMCLRSGGSTGGVDIISNYLHVKKHISFVKVQETIDAAIITSSALISVENVLYTLVRLFVYSSTINSFYKIYKNNRIEIVTDHVEEIKSVLLNRFQHGLTIYKCVGGFTDEEHYTIVVYASNFEINKYIGIIKEIDKNAFITVIKSKIEKSNYNQKPIL